MGVFDLVPDKYRPTKEGWHDFAAGAATGGAYNLLDYAGVLGSDEADAANAENRANREQQKTLAQEAQAFFEGRSNAGMGYIGQYGQSGVNALKSGVAGAVGAYGQGRDAGLGALGGGRDASLAALGSGYREGQFALGQGYGAARGDLSPVLGLQGYAGQARNAIGGYDAMAQRGDRLGSMLDQQGGLYGGFEQDPGYRFRQQQGEEAIMRNAAAQGGRGGGRTMKALSEFNQGLASQEYGNYAARRQAEAGMAAGADSQYNAMLQNQAGRYDQAQLAAQQNAMALAGMGYGAQGQLAGMTMGYGQQRAGMATDLGQLQAGYQQQYGQGAAGLHGQYAGQVGAASMQGGAGLADLYSGIGSGMANVAIGVGAQGVDTSKSLMGTYNDYVNNSQAIQQREQDKRMGLIGAATSIFG